MWLLKLNIHTGDRGEGGEGVGISYIIVCVVVTNGDSPCIMATTKSSVWNCAGMHASPRTPSCTHTSLQTGERPSGNLNSFINCDLRKKQNYELAFKQKIFLLKIKSCSPSSTINDMKFILTQIITIHF